ncbi:MAG: S8 family serine peptidase [Patescibacteria group bacterium]
MISFFRQLLISLVVVAFIFSFASLITTPLNTLANEKVVENLNFVPGEVLVKYKAGSQNTSKSKPIQAQNYNSRELPFTKITLPSRSENQIKASSSLSLEQATLDMVSELRSNPEVEWAEPNYLIQSAAIEINDPLFLNGSTWGLNNVGTQGRLADIDINAPEGWAKSNSNGENIKIAIIDSGVDYNHPDLAANIDLKDPALGIVAGNINGYNYCNGVGCVDPKNEDPMDNHGHGTSVAGVAAGVGQNSLGATGVCPKCKIMPIKVIDSTSFGDVMTISAGIYYAIDNGARVINLSLAAGGMTSNFISTAIAEAISKNIIVVSAAGNCGTENFSKNICNFQNQPVFPANIPDVIAVGSINAQGQKSTYSNVNDYVFVGAPGEGIITTCLKNPYCSMGGTSAAAPFVAGIAGLLLSHNPNLNVHSIKNILSNGAKDLGELGKDTSTGFGIPNLDSAIDQYTQNCTQITLNSFCAEYYNNSSLQGLPVIKAVEAGPSINKNWQEKPPEYLFQNNNYSVRYTGAFDLEEGVYTIKTQGGAGQFYLDDMDNPITSYSGNGENINKNTFNIQGGRYLLKFVFAQNEVPNNLSLEITKNEQIDFSNFNLDQNLNGANDIVKIVAGDFNGDQKSDLIKQETVGQTIGYTLAKVYLSNGDGTFAEPISITNMSDFNGKEVNIIPGDFNGDGKSDIIRHEINNWVDDHRDTEIYLSNGDGTFAEPISITNMSDFNGKEVNIIPGDFNGDGKSDLLKKLIRGPWKGRIGIELFIVN